MSINIRSLAFITDDSQIKSILPFGVFGNIKGRSTESVPESTCSFRDFSFNTLQFFAIS